MRGMSIVYPDYSFRPSDFLVLETDHLSIGPKPFLADVKALVIPEEDGSLDVEITSVKRDDGAELVAYLRSEAEKAIHPILRSFYLNESRSGLEGDVVNG